MNTTRSVASLVIAAALLVYAVPRLEIGQGVTPATVFGIVWIGFALLVIAAHLHLLLGVDEAKRKRLGQIRSFRLRQAALRLQRSSALAAVRKTAGKRRGAGE